MHTTADWPQHTLVGSFQSLVLKGVTTIVSTLVVSLCVCLSKEYMFPSKRNRLRLPVAVNTTTFHEPFFGRPPPTDNCMYLKKDTRYDRHKRSTYTSDDNGLHPLFLSEYNPAHSIHRTRKDIEGIVSTDVAYGGVIKRSCREVRGSSTPMGATCTPCYLLYKQTLVRKKSHVFSA